ncbi:LytR C-terminal domain-containing protein [Candidatus Daviesbacteria bacterium]|nr:LytR C-terminal domain-containing protein [Candidatus Daviesbacteria bacterium]
MPKRSAQSKKNDDWRQLQSRIKVKKQTKLALIVLGAIILIFLFSQLVNLTKTILSPWSMVDTTRAYRWDDQFNLNLLIKEEHLSVISFNPIEKKVVKIIIPDETYIDLPLDLGKWQVRGIQGVGGNQILKDSISSFLGIPLDGLIQFEGDLIAISRRNPLGVLMSLSKIKTDLTPLELIKFQMALSSVRYDKIEALDLADLNVLESEKLADGTEVFVSDPFRLDSILSDFADQTIVTEHKTIAVFNATSYPQLAQKGTRMIANLGGNVTQIANATAMSEKSLVLGEPSETLTRLGQIFDSSCEKKNECDKLSTQSLGLESSRAQINVILGQDFYQRFGNK